MSAGMIFSDVHNITFACPLPNSDLHDILRVGKLSGYVPRSWLDNLHELTLL